MDLKTIMNQELLTQLESTYLVSRLAYYVDVIALLGLHMPSIVTKYVLMNFITFNILQFMPV